MSNIQELEQSELGISGDASETRKMKVQSVSTVSHDTWLTVQKNSV